jgi:hypothetical protein
MKLRALLFALVLAGCASSSGGFNRSYEMAVPQSNAPELAGAVTEFVTHQATPTEPVWLETPKLGGATDTVTPLIQDELRRHGYRIATTDDPPATHVRWEIALVHDMGVLLRISLNNGDAAKLFTRSKSGALVPVSPFIVRASN